MRASDAFRQEVRRGAHRSEKCGQDLERHLAKRRVTGVPRSRCAPRHDEHDDLGIEQVVFELSLLIRYGNADLADSRAEELLPSRFSEFGMRFRNSARACSTVCANA